MRLEARGATEGVERRVIDRFREFDQVVEEPYDAASKGVGWLLDFTKLPGTVKGVLPDGNSNR